jgi:hypothetical protein
LYDGWQKHYERSRRWTANADAVNESGNWPERNPMLATRAGAEAAILKRLVKPNRVDLSPEAAEGLLQLEFDKKDRDRMHELAVKGNEGRLTKGEEEELESYRRIGYFVDLLRSKARIILKKHGRWEQPMEQELVDLVWRRANSRCEYCQMAQACSLLSFEIDHIIARKHGGQAVPENLCLACFYCNSFKGPNIASLNPQTGKLVQLFNPRRHSWKRCFRWAGPLLVGRTPIGRVTILVLCLNNPRALTLRQSLIEEGVFPPST